MFLGLLVIVQREWEPETNYYGENLFSVRTSMLDQVMKIAG